MAVYTSIDREALDGFLRPFGIGPLLSLTPIAAGTENTNYLLQTSTGKFILTLFEARTRVHDLPFYIGLMDHLAKRGLNCPVPVGDSSGTRLRTLADRPALLTTFLEGSERQNPEPAHCRAAGEACARLHLAGRDFSMYRRNNLSVAEWKQIFEPLARHADRLRDGLGLWIADELDTLAELWPTDLPSGVIHADMFPDNVFFAGEQLTGIIDFYFACNDFFAYDLAICLNSWCFPKGRGFDPDLAAAMVSGYNGERRLEEREVTALPILARGAAMRFLLTRLEDWFKHADSGNRKDPLEFLPIIETCRRLDSAVLFRPCRTL